MEFDLLMVPKNKNISFFVAIGEAVLSYFGQKRVDIKCVFKNANHAGEGPTQRHQPWKSLSKCMSVHVFARRSAFLHSQVS